MRFILMAALSLGLAVPALADSSKTNFDMELSRNSLLCGFTFFTDEGESLDFRGGKSQNCFDMKGGDDSLFLNREDFPGGIKVDTGEGRDRIWSVDGDDEVIDPDGEDIEIRTFGGNDRIEIKLPVDRDPLRGVETTGETNLFPGPGENRITVGKNIYSNAFARVSPAISYEVSPGASDRLEAICGRPKSGDVFDIRLTELPENARLDIDADGCGTSLFGIFGSLSIEQSGSRFALSTEGRKFRKSQEERLPLIQGRAEAVRGAFLNLTRSDPASNLWVEGENLIVARADFNDTGSGGTYMLHGRDEVRLEITPSPASADFELSSRRGIDVVVRATGAGDEAIRMAAPQMNVNWQYRGGRGFPRIRNNEPITVERTRLSLPQITFPENEIDRFLEAGRKFADNMAKWKEGRMTDADKDAGTEDLVPGAGIEGDLPTGVDPVAREEILEEIQPGWTRLSMVLRLENDRSGACVPVAIRDIDGLFDTVFESCGDLRDPVRRVVVDEAGEYDRIEIGGEIGLNIPINGETGFRVDLIEIDL